MIIIEEIKSTVKTNLKSLRSNIELEKDYFKSLESENSELLFTLLDLKDSEELELELGVFDSIKRYLNVIEVWDDKKYNAIYHSLIDNLNNQLPNENMESIFLFKDDAFNRSWRWLQENHIPTKDIKENLIRGLGAGGGGPSDDAYYNMSRCHSHFNFLKTFLLSTAKNISLLERISELNGNIVIIGSNGSGKSTLSRQLVNTTGEYGTDEFGINIIASNHYLFLPQIPYYIDIDGNHDDDIRRYQTDVKLIDEYTELDTESYINQFHNIINRLLINHHSFYSSTYKENKDDESSLLEKVITIYNKISVKNELFITDSILKVYDEKKTQEYSINNLSDGERQILYYLANCFVTENLSYLVIDEPENHLNPQVSKMLWNEIEKEFKNTIFIYITHDPNFATSRVNANIIWSKSFEYPDYWVYEVIESNELPTDLLIEVLGSKKDILFCEGTTGTDEYALYNSIYSNYKVIPVKGHKSVLEYVKVLNDMKDLHINAYGLIDADGKERDYLLSLVERNPKVDFLKFHEFEMLFYTEPVLKLTLEKERERLFTKFDVDEKIKNFRDAFYKKISERKEKIILQYIKNVADNYLESEKIQNFSTKENLEKSFQNIFEEFDIVNKYEVFSSEIDNLIKNEEYNELLYFCNLKTEITKELTNRYLSTNYLEIAKQLIVTDEELQKVLFENYLPKY